MLAEYVDFTDFLFNLGPGVVLSSPPVFYYLVWHFKDNVSAPLTTHLTAHLNTGCCMSTSSIVETRCGGGGVVWVSSVPPAPHGHQ